MAGTIDTTGQQAEESGRQVGILDHDLRQLQSTGKGVLGTLAGFAGLSLGGLGGGSLAGLFGGITASSLITGSVAASALIVGSVAAAALIVGTLATGDLITGVLAAGAVIGGTVLAGSLIAGSVAAAALIAGTVAAGSLVGGVVSVGALIVGTLAAGSLIVGTVAAAALIVGTVATGSLIVGTISAGALIVGTITAGSLVVGGVAAASIITGTVGIQSLLDIASGGTGFEWANKAGQDFAKKNPGMAETIHTGFTNNPVYDAGANFGEMMEGDWQYTGIFQSGGMVPETGPAFLHEGEAVLPKPLVDAVTSGAGGGGDGGGTTIEFGDVILNVDGGAFDPTDLSRRDVDKLADRLVEAMGRKTSNIAGTR